MRLVLIALAALAATVHAHPLAPSLLELTEGDAGVVDVVWKTPAMRPAGTTPTPALPVSCRTAAPATITAEDAAVVTRWMATCGALVGGRVGVDGLAPGLAALVRVHLRDGRVVRAVVSSHAPSTTIPERPGRLDVARDYVRLGIEHILGGPDHLLFVFGLLLLAGGGRRLLATITAFTAGHSVTLSLAALGVVAVPSAPVEVAIATSILVLAIELAHEASDRTLLGRRPALMAATFGLLHGLGFAAALHEAGLPAGEIPLALFAFNCGIEVGQLVFVVAVLVAGRAARRPLAALPHWTRRVPVYAMGSLAAFWWFARAAAWLG